MDLVINQALPLKFAYLETKKQEMTSWFKIGNKRAPKIGYSIDTFDNTLWPHFVSRSVVKRTWLSLILKFQSRLVFTVQKFVLNSPKKCISKEVPVHEINFD